MTDPAAGARPVSAKVFVRGLTVDAEIGVHAHEQAHVEVDGQTQQRRDGAVVAVGRGVDRREHEAQRLLVAEVPPHGQAAVLGGARVLRVRPREARHFRARDGEQAAVRDGLHCAVQERRRGAVRVQVQHVESVVRLAAQREQQRGVAARRL